MEKIKNRRIMYAKTLMAQGVDLGLNYFAQPDAKLRIIRENCKLFKFRSTNPCRTDDQQFYYAAQAGVLYLND